MNDNDVNGTKQPYCFASKDEDDRKNPLILSDSNYEHSTANGKYDGADEQLVVWKLINDKSDDHCNAVFDTNFNGTPVNAVSSEEKTYLDVEQCDCIQAWQRLKRYLELSDKELKRGHSSSHTFPEGIIFDKPIIDLNNDDPDKSLDDFQLDGEYLYEELDGPYDYDVSAYEEVEEETSSAKENTRVVVMDEREGRPADAETIVKPAKNGRNIKTTNAHAEVANKVVIVQKAEGNSVALNNEKQRKSKFGGKTNKLYVGGKKAGMDPKSNATTKGMNTMEYDYTYGETYRGGIQCGHVNCVESPITIPPNKGWITDDFLINERKKKLWFKSDENAKPDKPTARENDARKATRTVAAAGADVRQHVVVQRPKPKVTVNSHGVGRFANSVGGGGSRMREVVVAAAAAAALKTDGGGPNAKEDEPAAALEFVKNNGTYTVTMNCLTSDGQLDAATEPVVFRLAARTGDADAVSSSSSFDLKCVTPNAIRAMRPKKTYKHAGTSCTNEDFWPSKN